ncbi:hypothetical protein ACFXKS_12395 [Streptomyces scopuliridis]|uniref:hypothetical protein n=1 Tax=Streptomyces scopuliridis TaxID=452529 RepID=UPI0036A0B858
METDQWSLVVAVLAFVSAGWAVKYSRAQALSAQGQLDVARQVHREQSEPYVIVDIQPYDPGTHLLVLVIQNVGPTVARNVRVTATPELSSTHGDEITQALQNVTARTIPMIPPGRRLQYFFDTGARFGSALPMEFEFTVTSEGPMGPVETLRYTVDLAILTEELIGERPTKKLEEKLGKIADGVRDVGKYYQAANEIPISETNQRRRDEVSRRLAEGQQRRSSADDA